MRRVRSPGAILKFALMVCTVSSLERLNASDVDMEKKTVLSQKEQLIGTVLCNAVYARIVG